MASELDKAKEHLRSLNLHDLPEEELNEELQEHVTDRFKLPFLHHPLIVEAGYTPQLNALYNARFEFKLLLVQEAYEDKQWSRLVFLHERAYRWDALYDIFHKIETQQKASELFLDVWTDSENIHQWKSEIKHMLELVDLIMWMEDRDAAFFQILDETNIVYRGGTHQNINGLSWTTDYEKAEWFAKRFGKEDPVIVSGTILLDNILGVTQARNESEIIAWPHDVINKGIETL